MIRLPKNAQEPNNPIVPLASFPPLSPHGPRIVYSFPAFTVSHLKCNGPSKSLLDIFIWQRNGIIEANALLYVQRDCHCYAR